MNLAFLPSPDQGVWNLGPIPLRAYALCIIAGVVAAIWMGERRWIARGGKPGHVGDVAIWAIPFGLVGARLYHVATDYELYFGEGQDPITALYIWQGGLGIWGAIALGALGAYIACRRAGIKFLPLADALAPGIVVAQALGRWGNWFNQELFGKPTTVPWALEIDAEHRPDGYERFETFHPTFLYEFLWNLGVAGLVIWADRRFRLGFGRAFALYVMGYTAGRGWIEYLRIDEVQADDVFGLRLNVWTSIIMFLAAAAYFVWSSRRHPGREESVYRDGAAPVSADPADSAGTTGATDSPGTTGDTDSADSPGSSGDSVGTPGATVSADSADATHSTGGSADTTTGATDSPSDSGGTPGATDSPGDSAGSSAANGDTDPTGSDEPTPSNAPRDS